MTDAEDTMRLALDEMVRFNRGQPICAQGCSPMEKNAIERERPKRKSRAKVYREEDA